MSQNLENLDKCHFLKKSVKTLKSQEKCLKKHISQGKVRIILGQWVLALVVCIPLPGRYCSVFNMVLLINYLSGNPFWVIHVPFSFLSVCNGKLGLPILCDKWMCLLRWISMIVSHATVRYCSYCTSVFVQDHIFLLHWCNWNKIQLAWTFFSVAGEC